MPGVREVTPVSAGYLGRARRHEDDQQCQKSSTLPSITLTKASLSQSESTVSDKSEQEIVRPNDGSSNQIYHPRINLVRRNDSKQRKSRLESGSGRTNSEAGHISTPLRPMQRTALSLHSCSTLYPRPRHSSLQKKQNSLMSKLIKIVPVVIVTAVIFCLILYAATYPERIFFLQNAFNLAMDSVHVPIRRGVFSRLLSVAGIPVFVSVYYLLVFYFNRDVPEALTFVPFLNGRTKIVDLHFSFSLLVGGTACFILFTMPNLVFFHMKRIYAID